MMRVFARRVLHVTLNKNNTSTVHAIMFIATTRAELSAETAVHEKYINTHIATTLIPGTQYTMSRVFHCQPGIIHGQFDLFHQGIFEIYPKF